MHDLLSNTPEAPEALLARLDAAAQRFETPCGEGRMVWRSWGPREDETPPLVLLHGGSGDAKSMEVMSKQFAQKFGCKAVAMTFPGRLYLDDDSRDGNPDEHDPFGGNDGRNQALLDPDGPVSEDGHHPGHGRGRHQTGDLSRRPVARRAMRNEE